MKKLIWRTLCFTVSILSFGHYNLASETRAVKTFGNSETKIATNQETREPSSVFMGIIPIVPNARIMTNETVFKQRIYYHGVDISKK